MPPIWHIGFRHRVVAGFFGSEYRPKTNVEPATAQRKRRAQARGGSLRQRLMDSDDSGSEHESSKEYSYGPRSTRDDTHVYYIHLRIYIKPCVRVNAPSRAEPSRAAAAAPAAGRWGHRCVTQRPRILPCARSACGWQGRGPCGARIIGSISRHAIRRQIVAVQGQARD